MRKYIFSIAAAAAALTVAAPATAQVYAYGNAYANGASYGAPYGNAYGYRNGGQQWARELQQLRISADNLGRAGRLTRAEARDLNRDIRSVERSVYRAGRNGISRNESYAIRDKIARVRYELRRYSDRDGRRYDNRYRRY